MVVAFAVPCAPAVIVQSPTDKAAGASGATEHLAPTGTRMESAAGRDGHAEQPQGAAAAAAAVESAATAATAGAPAVPNKHQQQQSEIAEALGSPADVTGVLQSAATSQLSRDSAGPATPAGDGASSAGASSASASGRQWRAGGAPASPASEPSVSEDASAADAQAEAVAAVQQQAAAAEAAAARQRPRHVDVPALVDRLKQRPLSGQVAAWGWAQAAAVSAARRALPAQLSSVLWPATEACVQRMMPQDVLEVLEAWLALMQQCPRQFRLSRGVLEGLAAYALPAAVKRMEERQLAALAGLARDIALHRSDADMAMVSGPSRGASARDLMQPLFALAAAEAAWRVNNPARYVSPETVSAIITAAPAWSWRVVAHRDSHQLAALKLATAAALGELAAHSPRDLSPSAFRKLRLCPSAGSELGTPSGPLSDRSGGTTPRLAP